MLTVEQVFADESADIKKRLAPLLRVPAEDVTLEEALKQPRPRLKAMLSKRQFAILEAALDGAGVALKKAERPKKEPMSAGVKALTDLWGSLFREEKKTSYPWDLSKRFGGADWMSADWTAAHHVEMTVVAWVRGLPTDGDFDDAKIAGWFDNDREREWVLERTTRAMRGFIREFSRKGYTVSLSKFSQHAPKYLNAAEMDLNAEAPEAFQDAKRKFAVISREAEEDVIRDLERQWGGR